MQLKIFPCNAEKRPLIKEWQLRATSDPLQIKAWQAEFGSQLKLWGVKTGRDTGLFVLDVDVKPEKNINGFNSLTERNLEIPPTFEQTTRSGGKHYYFKYPKDGRDYGNRGGIYPGLDVRAEGGYVIYYGGSPEEASLSEPPPWVLTQAQKALHDTPAGTPSVSVSHEIIQSIFASAWQNITNAAAGESNHTLNVESFKLGQLVATGAVSREYAEEWLKNAASHRCKDPKESAKTIESGLLGGTQKPLTSPFEGAPLPEVAGVPGAGVEERWTPGAMTLEELLDRTHLRRPQLFKDWSTRDITLETADGGTGKTTRLLNEAICLALGERFLGFDCLVEEGRTLFITGEDTDKKLIAVLGGILRDRGLIDENAVNNDKIKRVLSNIRIKKDADLLLITKERGTQFIKPNPEALKKLLEAVEDFKPDMIVFDPISAFWGSEQSLNDMSRAVSRLMSDLAVRSNACVVMVNHMGKSSSANKDESQFAGRGGSALPSHARVNRVMHALDSKAYRELTGEELGASESAMMVRVNKFTDGSPLLNKPFILHRKGYLFTRKEMSREQQEEINHDEVNCERIIEFVRESRALGKYPTKALIVGYFAHHDDPIKKTNTATYIERLLFDNKLERIEVPTVKGDVYELTEGT